MAGTSGQLRIGSPHQMDIFEVLEDVRINGLIPDGDAVRPESEPEPITPVLEIVRNGFEYVVLVNGKRANDQLFWTRIEAVAFMKGFIAGSA